MKQSRMATARSRMGPQQLRELAQQLPDCCDRRYYLTVGSNPLVQMIVSRCGWKWFRGSVTLLICAAALCCPRVGTICPWIFCSDYRAVHSISLNCASEVQAPTQFDAL